VKTLKNIPSYAWTFLALILGIISGGIFPETFNFIAAGTTSTIQFIVKLVPILIFCALSPACASLVKRGLAGKFASSVILWFVLSSTLAGLISLVVSALFFRIPFTGNQSGFLAEAIGMFRVFHQGGASVPLIAIVSAILIGVISVWIRPLFALLEKIENAIGSMGKALGYIMVPILFCLGITIGVSFGPTLGMGHLLSITLYTFVICACWSLFYIFVIIKIFAKRPLKKLMTVYFLPTLVFAIGTISSLVTLPINLANAKKYGVRKEIADFAIPFGAVVNMDASALMNIAFIPFIFYHIFGVEVTWTVLLVAWPVIILFTIAAPGLPAGIGSSLWTATMVTSMLGIEEPLRSTIITTMVALYGGLPDMFMTAVNCTGDGLTSVLFDSHFGRFLKNDTQAQPPDGMPG